MPFDILSALQLTETTAQTGDATLISNLSAPSVDNVDASGGSLSAVGDAEEFGITLQYTQQDGTVLTQVVDLPDGYLLATDGGVVVDAQAQTFALSIVDLDGDGALFEVSIMTPTEDTFSVSTTSIIEVFDTVHNDPFGPIELIALDADNSLAYFFPDSGSVGIYEDGAFLSLYEGADPIEAHVIALDDGFVSIVQPMTDGEASLDFQLTQHDLLGNSVESETYSFEATLAELGLEAATLEVAMAIDENRELVFSFTEDDVTYSTVLDLLPVQDAGIEIYAGDDDDTLEGTEGDDLLSTGAGHDVAFGRGGSDELYGGFGKDDLRGGDGNDTLYGGAWHDFIRGNHDDDEMYGGDGKDDMNGGFGNDIVYGDGGNDKVSGFDGNDTLFGGDGQDAMHGGRGFDIMNGGAGDDVLKGAAGFDTLFGNTGDDLLKGGMGKDDLRGGDDNDSIYGGAWHDFVRGNHGNDEMFGGDGKDDMNGGIGDDIVYGDAGNDKVSGFNGNDTLFGGDGQDAMHGGRGDDVMNGGADNDVLRGAEGADTLSGDGGDDLLNGGAGADVYKFDLLGQQAFGSNDVDGEGPGGDAFYIEDAVSQDNGTDTIDGFTIGEDKIALDGSYLVGDSETTLTSVSDLTFDDIFLSQEDSFAIIEAGDTTIHLQGVNVDDLSEDDFILI